MTTSHGAGRPDGVRVTFRRMQFEFEQGFDRYWHSGSAFTSLFWAQLSTAFEPGERFFIDSARALKDRIDDPALAAEIAEFCRQEAHHTAQHLKFDRMNAAMGIDVEGCRKRYAVALGRARDQLDPMEMLAATCALEHFTSGFADLYFRRPEISSGADPRVLALWAWHAAEEAEHRGTCHDLYARLGGGYRTRVTIMFSAWFGILLISLINTVSLLRKDRRLWTRDTLRGLGYLFGRKGLVTGLGPAFLRYFRRDFEPWDGADAADIERWQAANARYIVNLDQVEQLRRPSGGPGPG